MPDEAQSNTVDPELTATIVAAYLQRNHVGTDQISALITTVHQALGAAGKPAEEPKERTPAVPIRRSVQQDQVICIECGWSGKMLRRHIAGHGLSVSEYRARWKLSPEHPLTAPGYSERRSAFAKQFGLGRKGNSTAAAEETAAITPAKAPPSTKPRSRGQARRPKRNNANPAKADAPTST